MAFGAGVLQAVGIFFLIAKTQRVHGGQRQFNAGELTVIKGPCQPVIHQHTHVVPTMGANILRLAQFLGQDHLGARITGGPQVIRHITAQKTADFRTDVFGDPAHFEPCDCTRLTARTLPACVVALRGRRQSAK